MKLVKLFGIALIAIGLSSPAMAQQSGGQPDQVDQLAQMVGLSEDQQKEIPVSYTHLTLPTKRIV